MYSRSHYINNDLTVFLYYYYLLLLFARPVQSKKTHSIPKGVFLQAHPRHRPRRMPPHADAPPRRHRDKDKRAKHRLAAALRTLRLDVDATEVDARAAYKSLARAHHPDKGGDAATFRAIASAYEVVCERFARERQAREKLGGVVAGSGAREEAWSSSAAAAAAPLEIRQGEDGASIAPSGDLKRLGDEAFDASEYERAIECYSAAAAYAKIDGATEYAELYRARGEAYAALERWREAIDDADRAMSVRALWSPPWVLKGRALEAMSAWSAAAALYRRRATSRVDADEDDADARALREGLERAESALRTEFCLASVDAHRGAVRVMAMKPSGRGLLAADAEADADVFDETIPTNAYVCTLGADDGYLKIFSVPSGECLYATKLSHAIRALSWAPDGGGTLVAVGQSGFVKTWDFEFAEIGAPRATLVSERELIGFHPAVDATCVTFDVSSEYIAVGASDGSACVWDVGAGALDHAIPAGLNAHKAEITSVKFHPVRGRAQLTSGSLDGDGRVWDLVGEAADVAGECLHTLRWDAGAVIAVDYTPCGRLIVTATSSSASVKSAVASVNRLLVWSSVSGRLCKWYDAHTSRINDTSWHPHPGSRNVVVSACDDGVLRVWSIRAAPSGAGKPLLESDEHAGVEIDHAKVDRRMSGAAVRVAHSPMGGILAVVTRDGRLRVHDSETLESTMDWRASAHGASQCVAWAPTPIPLEADAPVSRTSPWIVVTGGDDGRVCMWRITRGDDDDDGDDSADKRAGTNNAAVGMDGDKVAELSVKIGSSAIFSAADVKTWWDANENVGEVTPLADVGNHAGYLGPSPNDKPIHKALDGSPLVVPGATLTSKYIDLALLDGEIASHDAYAALERDIQELQRKRTAFMGDSSHSAIEKRAYAAEFAAEIQPLREQRSRVYTALKSANAYV